MAKRSKKTAAPRKAKASKRSRQSLAPDERNYVVGAVGPKGQSVQGKVYMEGDKIRLPMRYALTLREHGVPLLDA